MYQRQLSFGEAVKLAVTTNYCNFNGRSSRSEYWWFALALFILSAIIRVIFGMDTTGQIVSGIVNIALLLPSLGVAVRRMHDIGKSGWWVLINLIPLVGLIIFIVWTVKDSQPTPNQYGPVPNLAQR
ncbi:MAG: DUF805 domain-containing protein [Duncaniella sp.]|nr:DUF805 domain-containing protein [Duncaniella sp.]